MNRTMFLVDGFNVYHSLRDAQKYLGTESTRCSQLPTTLTDTVGTFTKPPAW
jgi:hypothetical protein